MFPGSVTKVSVGDLVRVGTTESVSVASWFFELTPGKGTYKTQSKQRFILHYQNFKHFGGLLGHISSFLFQLDAYLRSLGLSLGKKLCLIAFVYSAWFTITSTYMMKFALILLPINIR